MIYAVNWTLSGVANTFYNLRTGNTVNVMMHTAKHGIFKEQSCSYLLELLLLMPTAEFCASPRDNSTAFGTLELGTLHGSLNLFLTFV